MIAGVVDFLWNGLSNRPTAESSAHARHIFILAGAGTFGRPVTSPVSSWLPRNAGHGRPIRRESRDLLRKHLFELKHLQSIARRSIVKHRHPVRPSHQRDDEVTFPEWSKIQQTLGREKTRQPATSDLGPRGEFCGDV